MELVTRFNTLAKKFFLSADPEYAYKIAFLIFVYKCVWISVPNQTEAYMLQISHLSALNIFF